MIRFLLDTDHVSLQERGHLPLLTLRAQGIRIGTLDLRIVATALVHDLTLVTRNTKDFARVPGARLEDWAGL